MNHLVPQQIMNMILRPYTECLNSTSVQTTLYTGYIVARSSKCTIKPLSKLFNTKTKRRKAMNKSYMTSAITSYHTRHHGYIQRYIAGSTKCTKKPPSILTAVKDGLQSYDDTCYSRSGINSMWILKRSSGNPQFQRRI